MKGALMAGKALPMDPSHLQSGTIQLDCLCGSPLQQYDMGKDLICLQCDAPLNKRAGAKIL